MITHLAKLIEIEAKNRMNRSELKRTELVGEQTETG